MGAIQDMGAIKTIKIYKMLPKYCSYRFKLGLLKHFYKKGCTDYLAHITLYAIHIPSIIIKSKITLNLVYQSKDALKDAVIFIVISSH